MMKNQRGHMSLDEIAQDLGISVRTVYQMKNSPGFPPVYKFGKHYRVRAEDFEAFKSAARRRPDGVED